jgi:ABC-type sugar transport system ATPase subunit
VGARTEIHEITLEMKKSGISMILVSDDPKEYSILCDKIMTLKDGRIQEVLTPERFGEVMAG